MIKLENLENYKLSKPCDICKKSITLKDNTVNIKGRIIHVKCYDKSANKEEIEFLEDLFKQVRELRKAYAGLSALQWKIKDRLKELGVEK